MSEQPLKHWRRPFFTLWTGEAISLLTSAIVQMALIWHLTMTTHSAAILSIASMVGFLPMAILGSFAGTLVDRWNRKTTMIGADLFIAAASLFLVVYSYFAELPIWLVMAIMTVRSIGSAFHSPAISAVTPLMVPEDQLTKCSGYTQSLQTIGYIVGAAVAAVLYPIWSLRTIIMLDVLGAAIATIAVVMVKIPALPKQAEGKPKSHLLREMKEGYGVLKKHKGLFQLLWLGAGYMLLFSPINALFPLMCIGHFGGGPAESSVSEIAFSLGMLGGGILLGVWGGFKDRAVSIIGAMALMGVAIAVSGLLPASGFVLFAVFCVVMGFTAPFYTGPHTALMQEKIAPEYLGRVFGLYTSIASLAMPVGLVFSALLADTISVPGWFIISGTGCALLAVVAFALPSIRQVESDSADGAGQGMMEQDAREQTETP